MSKQELPHFTIKQLLEAGVHFGHKTMRRNPKMTKYIHTNRNGVSIIDLNKTANLLHNSLKVVRDIAKNNGRILFIGTKKQAIEPIAEAAKRCGQYYVNFRWLGGMLTNWKTVSQSIKTLRKIEERLTGEEIDYNKKEKLVLERKRQKLEQALGGIKNMGGSPDLIFVIDTYKESLAIAEAKKLGVPIMAILDSNCNPDGIVFPIPGNDDSAKSIKLYCRLISDAAIAGTKENMSIAGIDISKISNENISEMKNAVAEKKSAERKPAPKKEFSKAKEFSKKEIVKKEVTAENSEEKASVEKKPATKKPAAKKPAAKK
jgi:small subunit ribosomal protein S2